MTRLEIKIREIFEFLRAGMEEHEISTQKAAQLEYLAERRMMQELGAPLLDGQYFVTKDGPQSLAFARAAQMLEGSPIPPQGTVKRVLSRFEVNLLVEITGQFGEKTEDELTAILREQCPEWKGREAGELERADIWRAMSFAPDRIERLEDRFAESQGLAEFWNMARELSQTQKDAPTYVRQAN